MDKGIDISYHNGNIDFNKVKESGIKFVIIRASYGFFNLDKKVIDYIKGCESVGLPYGFYHYSYATNLEQAKKEVKGFLNFVKDYNPTYPLIIDMEDADNWKKNNGNPSNQMYINICEYFCNEVEKAGYYAMIYANTDWFTNKLNSSILDRFDKWLADWRTLPNETIPRGILQFTSTGKVPGINGNVDLNYSYKNYPSIIKNMKNNSKPQIKSNYEIADEVIKGLWGNGDERKQKLTTAGYNYQDIQNIVNEKLFMSKPIEYYPSFNNQSIVDGLKSIGVDSSFSNRQKIALKNGIFNYKGTQLQNMILLRLAKKGKLIK